MTTPTDFRQTIYGLAYQARTNARVQIRSMFSAGNADPKEVSAAIALLKRLDEQVKELSEALPPADGG